MFEQDLLKASDLAFMPCYAYASLLLISIIIMLITPETRFALVLTYRLIRNIPQRVSCFIIMLHYGLGYIVPNVIPISFPVHFLFGIVLLTEMYKHVHF